MYIQDQLPHDRITDDNLSYYKAIGVDYLTVNSLPLDLHTYPEMVEFLSAVRDRAAKNGLRFYNAALTGPDEITLAQPDRDAKIEEWCNWLRAMSTVGVPTLGYNFKPVCNFRTPSAAAAAAPTTAPSPTQNTKKKTTTIRPSTLTRPACGPI